MPKPKAISAALVEYRCADAYWAVRWYRSRYNEHRTTMRLSPAPPVEQAMDCERLRERAAYWVHAAKVNREATTIWRRTIHNRPSWLDSIDEVQRAFPGTASWLRSCSAAESRWGSWVLYGGRPYYPGAEYAKTFHGDMVGGPLQYMWNTFKGHYRRGLDSLRSRGFKVNLPPPSDVAAWRSMTATAIAAGWARWSGNDGSHWSASWGNGC